MKNSKSFKGIILLIVGIFFLLINFDFISFNIYTDFFRNHLWMFLVGAILVFNKKSLATGIAFIAIGSLFVMSNMGMISHVGWSNIWPLFIIAAGFNIIINRNGKKLIS